MEWDITNQFLITSLIRPALVRSWFVYLRMWILPCPLVKKNKSPSLFHEISFTSELNCFSTFERCVLVSMNVTKSTLFPTAIVEPSGDQQMFMFSPAENKYTLQ